MIIISSGMCGAYSVYMRYVQYQRLNNKLVR